MVNVAVQHDKLVEQRRRLDELRGYL